MTHLVEKRFTPYMLLKHVLQATGARTTKMAVEVQLSGDRTTRPIGTSSEAQRNIFLNSTFPEALEVMGGIYRPPPPSTILEFDLKGIPLDSSSFLVIVVKDFETIGQNKLIGTTTVSLKDLTGDQNRSSPYKQIPLLNEKGQDTGATIDLVIGYNPPSAPHPNDPSGTSVSGMGEEEDEDQDEDRVDGMVRGPGPKGPSGTLSEAQLARRITRGKNSRRMLSNKPQDFQIRVRVIEGRQLCGNNIRPVVKVHICGQTHRTRIKRGNNPFFDELFFYNVHITPSELMDEIISIRVYNSHSLRADCLMGEFKIDVGFVYDEPGHAVMRKWLLLNDPEDASSGAKGYMKVSMFVLGTGDEPPPEKRDRDNDSDDVESNLLLPAGVALRWVTFLLKIYRAEDIPQMDDAFSQTVKEIFGGTADKKNLVDPFVEVSFAGKKPSEEEVWANVIIISMVTLGEGDRDRSQLHFTVRTLKSREVRDRLTKNDVVGTTYLYLSKIAASGGEVEANTGETEVGFVPTFGPCYLNLYGSPREYTGFPDPYDELNTGKKYQRRRKYSLSAVFHSATMLQDVGEAIQFEVSIGNYGNKFDATCKPLASTTQYSRAVFDGNYYYYLPWAQTKPVVTLTSYWEDISHRLDAVNTLLVMAERLQSNIEAVKSGIQGKIPANQLAELWLKLIDEVIEDTRYTLPVTDGKANVTVLDTQIRKLRSRFLSQIHEAAMTMRSEATDVKSTLLEIEDWLDKLMQLTEEPQNSMPDIIIWMIRGEKRLAYARIPAHQVLYSTSGGNASGKYCGKTQTILLKYPQEKNNGPKVPVELRVNIWLGLSAVEKKFNSFAEGSFTVFAEMYENQALVFGKWGTSGLVGRHKFSDVTGKIKLKREFFLPPKGWEWEGDWIVDPERSLLTEADAGHTEFTDEVYQNETRYPGGEWKAAEDTYTDAAASPSELTCPPGWEWEDDAWTYDINRAVDEKGWEYGITIPPDNKPKSWVAAEKMYHTHRRRRLVRKRKKDLTQTASSTARAMEEFEDREGWEYASLIGWKFHWKQRSSDTFRRRRWRRKMAPSETHGAAAIFKLEGALGADTTEDGDEKSSEKQKHSATTVFGANTPIVSCNFDRVYVYHLRCYIYQARNLMALDKDSFSDPYAHVSFLHRSKTTEIIHSTLNPTWDQTIIFDEVEIFGEPQTVLQNPPKVIIELFDNDQVLNSETDVTPKLLWHLVMNGDKACGDVLVTSELILRNKDGSNLPILPSQRAPNLYMVPPGIRPVVQLTAIEFLPKEELYMPPLVIKVIDHRQFGRKPVVGQCTIDHLDRFRCDPYEGKEDIVPQLKASLMSAPPCRDVVIEIEDTKPLLASKEEEIIDWWSKFYASSGEHEKCGQYIQKGYSKLKIYDCELEDVAEFEGLTDFSDTFKLYRGKSEENEDPSVVGEFKGSFRIYPLPDDPSVPAPPRQFRELPDSVPQECTVRIYIVQGLELQPQDNNGLCDPYIKITLGKKVIEDRDHYIPNTLNPVFGRMYELSCYLPQDKDLKISVYDYDTLTRDEKVGETIIDLENRFLSRFGSHCGLPEQYCVTQGLVPEHVETRTLHSTFQPNISQGKLQMWVDVFPKSLGPPGPPFNITPRKAKKYFLRVIIWNTKDVILDEKSITGEDMSDIYVKGWISGCEDNKQKTDVHYRSLDGEGNFNWRFVFPFDYLPAEQLCIVAKKEHFWSIDQTEFRVPPRLIIQIWDNDKFSLDDYLGFLELDLHHTIIPAKSAEKCSLDMIPDLKAMDPLKAKTASLFEQKSMKGWWPCYMDKDGARVMAV
ncbi:Myoferlin [Microtus ochrogaster]|uniref:Myoferlin n=1 Tax=Microtus ochrogaster TaxID=79684 RepID=A0A8J6H3Y0_MICOH|nr:Myoferlin [Microtus ochrogaster]